MARILLLMADTRFLTTIVEDFVRNRLAVDHGVSFTKRRLPLTVGGDHEFDAVSEDGTIVASIKATSGKTSGGRIPAGKFNNAIAELYFLAFVAANKKLLVVTNTEFHKLLLHKIGGSLPPNTTIEGVELPADIQTEVNRLLGIASTEVSPQAIEAAVEAEVDEDLTQP